MCITIIIIIISIIIIIVNTLFCFTDRNLNPKAACLKRREEEKALRLTTSAMSDALTTSLMDSNLPSSLQAQSIFYPGTNSPPLTGGRSSTPTHTVLSTSHPRPFSYTPSPPSTLTPTDKIPRRSDPPMKKRSNSGNLSPTLRKNKGRLPINTNNLITGNMDIESLTNPVTSS